MATISQFPYFEVQFTKDGAVNDPQEASRAVDGIKENNTTDLLVFSHGWNNDMDQARQLVRDFFVSARSVIAEGQSANFAGRKFAVLAILWPSKKFADRDLIASGAASMGGGISDEAIQDQIDDLKEALDSAEAETRLEEAKQLVTELEFDPAARDAFVEKIRSLLPPPAKDEEVANAFFDLSGDEIMSKLKAPLGMPGPTGGGGAASMGRGPSGGAAGLGDLFSGVKAAARRVLNYTTYYLMKERAGIVGRDGVNKVVSQIVAKSPEIKVHLIGHSFGGRVVTAAANALGDDPVTRPASMSLLQAAFSHNGFATKFDGRRDGFFRKVVTDKKVKGPIIITYTHNDTAVGWYYPLASKISGDDALAVGDEKDRFGGLGRNGALLRCTPEAQAGQLLKSGSAYSFSAGKLFNLEATKFISEHNDVAGKEVANAVLEAVAAT